MISAVLLCLLAPGCADQQPTAPKLPAIARSSNVPFNRFFVAWSENYLSGPIQPQVFAVDNRQTRQYAAFEVHQDVLEFARANPGRLYINGDEPDQYCIPPSDYAVVYHDFAAAVRSADPTARLSPAGVAEPNYHCCPLPDDVPTACWFSSHSIGYMDQFYNAYVQRYGSPPPVNEWRFHDFGIVFPIGDVAGWWARIDKEATWAASHGAPMVLGAFGFNAWAESEAAYVEHLKQAMNLLLNDTRIVEVDYWSLAPWVHSRFPLMNTDGSLTLSGQVYVNPLTDVPTGPTLVGSDNGRAQLQWTNTTNAWGAEVEYWVRSREGTSFNYRNSARVSTPGATQTPADVFNGGDSVKARVRYYNAYGQAGWSSFSNPVFIPFVSAPPPPPPPPPAAPPAAPPPPPPDPATGNKGYESLLCFSPKRIDSPPCK